MTFYSKSLTTYCGLATYKCQKCTEEFTCLLKLAVHLNGEHERINNRSQCPICPKNYHKNFTKVTNHIKSVHLNVKKKCKICQDIVPFRCEICVFFFSSRSLKTREKYISFAQFVNFLMEVCLLFNF